VEPAIVDCHFGAQMPPQPALGSRTRVEVIMSRKPIDLAISATSAVTGPVPTAAALALTIEVIALKNGKVLDPNPAEVTTFPPADDNPVKFVFRVDGNAVGAAEFLIEVRRNRGADGQLDGADRKASSRRGHAANLPDPADGGPH
jgi:hypothetical protein